MSPGYCCNCNAWIRAGKTSEYGTCMRSAPRMLTHQYKEPCSGYYGDNWDRVRAANQKERDNERS
jgi:hypothetical protein